MKTVSRRGMRSLAALVAVALAFSSTGCFRGGGRLLGAMAWTAIVTTAIVSSQRPPAPVVVYAPPPHQGYTWQAGYWTLVDGEWEWVEGRWVRNYPGYRWSPTHWVEDGDGRWRLVPGHWVAMGPAARIEPDRREQQDNDEPPPPADIDRPTDDEVAPPAPQ